MKMFYIIFIFLFISISYGTNYDFLLANGPTYVNGSSIYFFPYGDPRYNIKIKLLRVDPHEGLWISVLKAKAGVVIGTHRHYGQAYGYTLKGAWGNLEHPEWVSKQGDLVHETPGSVHTFYTDADHGETEALSFIWGAIEFLGELGNTLGIEDWRSILQKYIDYGEKNNLPIIDVTYPKSKVPDIHFHHQNKKEL
ncbi:unnamed protein product [Rotaria sp. Silwood2]|nr:unnamed protein product [Rotaria sp. Silwood2]CAF3102139.1 unnamed protein product [Rotaria sp. Silwood2]CAF3522830.1 unnamed protein product [Rotaria sp. Silwood2]CAF4441083.1 unnamed protein product [Rotaria sp. Silwood2]CAF4755229.1 unnamed protein product [Rotaria sp. Silwood2]